MIKKIDSLPFLKGATEQQRTLIKDALVRAEDESAAIAVIGGGTPLCYQDGNYSYGKATMGEENGSRIVQELGDGPSKHEVGAFQNAASLFSGIQAPNSIFAVPYFDTQGMKGTDPKEARTFRKKVQQAALKNPGQYLPEEYAKILKALGLDPKIIKILLSSGYGHATSDLVKNKKKRVDKKTPEEAEQGSAELFEESGAILLSAYEDNSEPPHTLLSTPLSRQFPRDDFRRGIDVIDSLQDLGAILMTFVNRTHCGMVSAGRLTAVRRILGKAFPSSVDKETPISTFTFMDIADGGLDGVNWMRAVDFLTTLNTTIDHHILVLLHRGKIANIVSSDVSLQAKNDFLHELAEAKKKLENELRSLGVETSSILNAWRTKTRERLKTEVSVVKSRLGEGIGAAVVVPRGGREDSWMKNQRKLIERQAELIKLLSENGFGNQDKARARDNLLDEIRVLEKEIAKLGGRKGNAENCETGQCAL